MGASHPAAQLIELCQPQLVGAVHDNGVGIGNINTAFDNRRAQQQIETLVIEILHDLLQFFFAHLPVGGAYLCFRHQISKLFCNAFNRADFIMQKIDLPTATDFTQDGLTQQGVVPFPDEGADGEAP